MRFGWSRSGERRVGGSLELAVHLRRLWRLEHALREHDHRQLVAQVHILFAHRAQPLGAAIRKAGSHRRRLAPLGS
jgi:hypothetical protein